LAYDAITSLTTADPHLQVMISVFALAFEFQTLEDSVIFDILLTFLLTETPLPCNFYPAVW
jgi:hypothetical protein